MMQRIKLIGVRVVKDGVMLHTEEIVDEKPGCKG